MELPLKYWSQNQGTVYSLLQTLAVCDTIKISEVAKDALDTLFEINLIKF